MPIERHARFQPQSVACAQTAGPNPKLLARLHQRGPYSFCRGHVARQINLKAILARVARASDQHIRHARNLAPRKPIILDPRQLRLRQLLQRLQPARPLHRQLRIARRIVRDPHLRLGRLGRLGRPRVHLLHNPRKILVLVPRVHHQKIIVLAVTVNQNVVHIAAIRRQQRGILRLPILQPRGIVHRQVLHGGQRSGSAKPNLAHVAHVEQPHAGAHRHMLRNQPAANPGVLHRHIPPAKIHHLRFQCAMRGVQCGFLQRRGERRSRFSHK